MRRKRKSKQKKLVIITSICLLLCLCVGYAAFQTNISIIAKGNVIEKTYTIEEFKNSFCNTESGDGLYVDTYEAGRCVYKGSDPDNYILFNDELWRIIAIETDGTLKIINLDSTLEKEYNTYSCSDYINDNDGEFGVFLYDCDEDTLIIPWDGKNMTSYLGSDDDLPDAPEPTLNKYLNTEYLNSIDSEFRSYIVSHDFYIGKIGITTGNFSTVISNEKSSVWNGYIALPNVSDFLRASSSSSCTNVGTCGEENYFAEANGTVREDYWFYTWPTDTWIYYFSQVYGYPTYDPYSSGSVGPSTILEVKPTLYLSEDITLTGKGTQSNPYEIVS